MSGHFVATDQTVRIVERFTLCCIGLFPGTVRNTDYRGVRLSRELYIARIGPIFRTFTSVHIIEASAFQGCPQGRVPLYYIQVCGKLPWQRAVYEYLHVASN